jgi:WD40 repeat protein
MILLRGMLLCYQTYFCMQASGLVHILEGHLDKVCSVAISANSKIVASCSHSGEVKLWDTDTGACTHTLEGHTGTVTGLDFSRDGTLFVSCSDDKSIKVWTLANGPTPTLMHTLTGHEKSVRCVKLSPDGTRIASGSYDSTVKIWSVQSGELLLTLEGHEEDCGVLSVGWSPDGRLVASGRADGTVRVWDVAEGKEAMEPLKGHNDDVTCVEWSSTARYLVSSGRYDIVVWGLQEGRVKLLRKLEKGNDRVGSLSLSPDGLFMACKSNNNIVCVWDVGADAS